MLKYRERKAEIGRNGPKRGGETDRKWPESVKTGKTAPRGGGAEGGVRGAIGGSGAVEAWPAKGPAQALPLPVEQGCVYNGWRLKGGGAEGRFCDPIGGRFCLGGALRRIWRHFRSWPRGAGLKACG